ncbi:MAG: P13 family porin [Myxococcota bacterium]
MSRHLKVLIILAISLFPSLLHAAPSFASHTSYAHPWLTPNSKNHVALSAKAGWLLCGQQREPCQDTAVVEENKGPNLVAGLLLNIVLPFAIGSWIYGDIAGGLVGTVGQVIGIGVILSSALLASSDIPIILTVISLPTMLAIAGIAILGFAYIVPIITLIVHSKRPRRAFRLREQDQFQGKRTSSFSARTHNPQVASVPMLKLSF